MLDPMPNHNLPNIISMDDKGFVRAVSNEGLLLISLLGHPGKSYIKINETEAQKIKSLIDLLSLMVDNTSNGCQLNLFDFAADLGA